MGYKQPLVDSDPHTNTLGSDQRLLDNVYKGLTILDPRTLTPVGEVAESWSVSEDKLTWTFKLRPGVKFHNGRVVKAADVKYSMDRILNPDTLATIASDLEPVKKVEIVDHMTVEFRLSKPYGLLPIVLQTPAWAAIIPEGSGDSIADEPIGTGPFRFASQVVDTSLTLRRFDDYWREGLPILDGLFFLYTPDESTQFRTLQSDQVDFTDAVPLALAKAASRSRDTRVVLSQMGGRVDELFFNCRQPPFDDVRARQAVAMALDKREIARAATFGTGEAMNTMVPPASPINVEVKALPHDPARARQMIKELGLTGLELDLSPCGGEAFPAMSRASEVIASQLETVGINVSTRFKEPGIWADEIINNHAYKASVCGLVGGADPDQATFRYFYSDGVYNFSQYPSTPRLDRLLLRGREVSHDSERKRIYDAAWQILADEVPWIPLYAEPQIVGMSRSVGGFIPQPDSFRFDLVGFLR